VELPQPSATASGPWLASRHEASGRTPALPRAEGKDQAAWLCDAMTGTKAAELLRTTWRSLQAIVERVVADLAGKTDRLDGLRKIGIDEIAYRKLRFLMVVVDHGTGRLVWAAEGRNEETVRAFFSPLGPEQAARLAEVSADGAEWIHDVIREQAPQARICLDSYHVVAWANKALDKVRRRLAAELRVTGAAELKDTRWAAVPVRRPRLRDRRHRRGDAGRSPRLHRAVAVARVRLNQVATSISRFRRCPADALRGGWRAVASCLVGGGSRCVRSVSVIASRRCRPEGPGLRRRCAPGWWALEAGGAPGSGSGCGGRSSA
jgi:transposase